MAGAGKRDQDQGSQELQALLAVGVITVLTATVIWWFYRAPLVYFILALNWVEVQFVSLTHGGLGEIGTGIVKFMDAVFSARREASLVSADDLGYVMTTVGTQVRLYIVAAIIGLAIWCTFRMRGEGNKTFHNLDSFAAYQAKYWKVALASSKFDYMAADDIKRSALKPMEWLKKHNLPLRRAADGRGELDIAATSAAFAAQLGDNYIDIANMPVYAKALAVTFNLSRLRDGRVLKMKEDLTEIWTLSNDRATAEKKTEELIAPYLADKAFVTATEKILGGHAFLNTALTGLFTVAKKKGGVLACAEILWLRNIDRDLWYALQNVGRHAYYIEGAGSCAHYFAEVVSKGRKIEPYVVEAVHGLQEYLAKHSIVDMKEYDASVAPKD